MHAPARTRAGSTSALLVSFLVWYLGSSVALVSQQGWVRFDQSTYQTGTNRMHHDGIAKPTGMLDCVLLQQLIRGCIMLLCCMMWCQVVRGESKLDVSMCIRITQGGHCIAWHKAPEDIAEAATNSVKLLVWC
jgi:hypothetical protein